MANDKKKVPSSSNERISKALEESPVKDGELWSYVWGAPKSPGTDRSDGTDLTEKIGDAIINSSSCTSVLVHGRYGSGKTSAIKLIVKRIEAEAWDRVKVVWLHMPVLANSHGPVEGLILSAIVDALCRERDGCALCQGLYEILEDYWNIEQFGHQPKEGRALEPPAAARMVSRPGQASKAVRSARLEYEIQRFMEKKEIYATKLVVVLDDLDRCHLEAMPDIVKTLQRFSAPECPVNFIIGSSRAILENGLEAWMKRQHHAYEEQLLVTAASALEKYIHYFICIPALGAKAQVNGPEWKALVEREDLLLDEINECVQEDRELSLADIYLLKLLSKLKREDFFPPRRPKDKESADGTFSMERAFKDEGLAGEADEKRLSSVPSSFVTHKQGLSDSSRESDIIQSKDSVLVRTDQGKENDQSMEYDGSFISQSKESDKKKDEFDIEEKSTKQLLILRELLCRNDEGSILIRGQHYRLIRLLTLRQLKTYLRHLFLPGDDDVDGEVGMDPAAMALIREIFHPYWNLCKSEREIFDEVASTARVIIDGSDMKSTSTPRITSMASSMFLSQLQRVAASSVQITDDNIKTKFWPSHAEEQILLLELLAAARRDTPVSDGRPARKSFDEWVFELFGQRPEGNSMDAKISSFQDLLLNEHGNSVTSAEIIKEYMWRYWEAHSRSISSEAATSLSNLAVMVDDHPGFEAETYALFRRANDLGPHHERMRFYFAEFLLDVLKEHHRFENLSKSLGISRAELVEQVQSLLAEDEPVSTGQRVYRDSLSIRLHYLLGGVSLGELENLFLEMVVNCAEPIMESAQGGDLAPLVRLDRTLDSVFGKESGTLRQKGTILGAIWQLFEVCGVTSLPARIFLANDYVGQSGDNSPEEKLGICMNRGILIDGITGDGLALAFVQERLGSIFTQTALTLDNFKVIKPEERRTRGALAFILTEMIGQLEGQSIGRAEKFFSTHAGGAAKSKDELMGWMFAQLGDEQREMLQSLAGEADGSNLIPVVEALFGEEFPRISWFEEFAENVEWLRSSSIKERIAEVVDTASEKACPEGN